MARKSKKGPGLAVDRTRLQMHELENRLTPTVNVNLVGDVLFIVGDSDSDTVLIQTNATGDIAVTATGGAGNFDGLDVRAIQIDLGAGANELDIDLTADDTTAEDGIFNDQVLINVVGGVNVDDVDIQLGDNTRDFINISTFLGSGNDIFNVQGGNVAQPDITFDAYGQGGADTFTFNFAGNLDGTVDAYLDGGSGNDVFNFTTGGDVNGDYSLFFHGDIGNDDLVTDVAGSVSQQMDLDIELAEGDDTHTATIGVDVTGNLFLTSLNAEGNDDTTLNVNGDVTGTITSDVQQSSGADTFTSILAGASTSGNLSYTLRGEDGNDTAIVNADASNDALNDVVLALDGGSGSDTYAVDLPATGVAGTFDVTLIGGLGNDINWTLDTGDLDGDALITADMGPGVNTLDITTGNVNNDTFDVSLTGGSGADTFNLTTGVVTNAQTTVEVELGQGLNTFNGTFNTVVAPLDLSVNGGNGNDAITVDLGAGSAQAVNIGINLSDGNDTFDFTTGIILGGGFDLLVDAGSGGDDVTYTVANDIIGPANFLTDMGDGDDNLTITVGGDVEDNDDVVFEQDGGAGSDVLDLANFPAAERADSEITTVNFETVNV